MRARLLGRCHVVQSQDGGHQVGGLRERRNPLAAVCCVVGMPDHQGDMRYLLIVGHPVLGPPLVFAKQIAVVCRQDHRRVLPGIVGIHPVKQSPKMVVAHRHQRGVIGPDFGNLLGRVRAFLIERPIQDWALVARRELLLVLVRRVEGFMRIEALDLQEPVVAFAVPVEEFEGLRKAFCRREIFVFPRIDLVNGVT